LTNDGAVDQAAPSRLLAMILHPPLVNPLADLDESLDDLRRKQAPFQNEAIVTVPRALVHGASGQRS
jgi:hypothetical protein